MPVHPVHMHIRVLPRNSEWWLFTIRGRVLCNAHYIRSLKSIDCLAIVSAG